MTVTLSPPARPSLSRARALLGVALFVAVLAPSGIAAAACPATAEDGYELLFDGTSLDGWTQAGPGSFDIVNCELRSTGGMGLLWYSAEEFGSYTLRAEWKIDKLMDNSGIFVGFPEAGNDPWVAVNEGYEIQIDQFGRMDGAPEHYTGAIYDIQGPNRDTRVQGTDPVGWNTYEITVDDPKITIVLNGEVVNEFVSTDARRDLSSGYIGLQNHGDPDNASFRNVQIKRIEPGSGGGTAPPPVQGALTALRNNTGIAQDPTSNADFDSVGYSYSSVALQVAGVSRGSTISADGMDFTWPDTASGTSDNVIARGQIVPIDAPAGATKLSFLTAADHGPSTATFLLNYESSTEAGTITETVPVTRTVSDWTLNGGGAQPSPGNVTAVTTAFRTLLSAAPEPTDTHVFAVSIPLDPTKRLASVKLPLGYAGQIHLFDLAVR